MSFSKSFWLQIIYNEGLLKIFIIYNARVSRTTGWHGYTLFKAIHATNPSKTCLYQQRMKPLEKFLSIASGIQAWVYNQLNIKLATLDTLVKTKDINFSVQLLPQQCLVNSHKEKHTQLRVGRCSRIIIIHNVFFFTSTVWENPKQELQGSSLRNHYIFFSENIFGIDKLFQVKRVSIKINRLRFMQGFFHFIERTNRDSRSWSNLIKYYFTHQN